MIRHAIDSSGQLLSSYDALHDRIIQRPSKSVQNLSGEYPQTLTCKLIMGNETTKETLLHQIGIEDELRLSLLLKIITTNGITSFLHHPLQIDQYTRIIYYQSIKRRHSWINDRTLRNRSIICETPHEATHLITSIDYGLDFLIISHFPSEIQSIQIIDDTMKSILQQLSTNDPSRTINNRTKEEINHQILHSFVYSNQRHLENQQNILQILHQIETNKNDSNSWQPIQYSLQSMDFFQSEYTTKAFQLFYPLDSDIQTSLEYFLIELIESIRHLQISINCNQQQFEEEVNRKLDDIVKKFDQTKKQLQLLLPDSRNETEKAIEISELLKNGDVLLLKNRIKQLKDVVIKRGLARSATNTESLEDQKPVEKHHDQCLDLIISPKKCPEKKSTDRFSHSNEYSTETNQHEICDQKDYKHSSTTIQHRQSSTLPKNYTSSSSTTKTFHHTSNSPIVLSNHILTVQLRPSSTCRSDDSPKCSPDPLTSSSIIKPHEQQQQQQSSSPSLISVNEIDQQTLSSPSNNKSNIQSHSSAPPKDIHLQSNQNTSVHSNLSVQSSNTSIARIITASSTNFKTQNSPSTPSSIDISSRNSANQTPAIDHNNSSFFLQHSTIPSNLFSRSSSKDIHHEIPNQTISSSSSSAVPHTFHQQLTSQSSSIPSSDQISKGSTKSVTHSQNNVSHYTTNTMNQSSSSTIEQQSSMSSPTLHKPIHTKSSNISSIPFTPDVLGPSSSSSTQISHRNNHLTSQLSNNKRKNSDTNLLPHSSSPSSTNIQPNSSTTSRLPSLQTSPINTTSSSPKSIASQPINILLLGESGVGKSTFINALANYLTFQSLNNAQQGQPVVLIPVSFILTVGHHFDERIVTFGEQDSSRNENFNDRGQSVTQQCRSYTFDLPSNPRKHICIIDTPGFGDTRGIDQDQINIKHISDYISQLSHIDAICFLLKPNESRMNIFFRLCFTQLFSLLGLNTYRNLIFCFTETASTFYTMGDTVLTLRKILRILNTTGEVKMEKKNTFCFDNEAFRYLVARQNGIDFSKEEQEEYENSWKISVNESSRLLNTIDKSNESSWI